MKTILIALAVLALAGCSPTVTGSLCTALPIVPGEGFEQRWTVAEKQQVLVANESSDVICGR